MARTALRLRKRHVVTKVKTDYPEGHVETVAEYLVRGGAITRASVCGFSRHLTDTDALLTILTGGSTEDADRGFAWSDFPSDLRERLCPAVTVDELETY